jgi:spore coat protein A
MPMPSRKANQYLGGVIVATHGRPVKLKIANQLPSAHILPVDPTTIDPPMVGEVAGRVDRITVHLHGAVVRGRVTADQCPGSQIRRNPGGFAHGSAFLNHGPHPGSAVYEYPNPQSARLVWYHDHAYGITRLNAYSGLASAYLITDDAESMMIKSGVLPDLPGYHLGIPLIIQDKSFFDPASDPNVPGDSCPTRRSVVPACLPRTTDPLL